MSPQSKREIACTKVVGDKVVQVLGGLRARDLRATLLTEEARLTSVYSNETGGPTASDQCYWI